MFFYSENDFYTDKYIKFLKYEIHIFITYIKCDCYGPDTINDFFQRFVEIG